MVLQDRPKIRRDPHASQWKKKEIQKDYCLGFPFIFSLNEQQQPTMRRVANKEKQETKGNERRQTEKRIFFFSIHIFYSDSC